MRRGDITSSRRMKFGITGGKKVCLEELFSYLNTSVCIVAMENHDLTLSF